MRRMGLMLLAGIIGLSLWAGTATPAHAQAPDASLNRYFYYPYYYSPTTTGRSSRRSGRKQPGSPYMRPPAYMAYPAFTEPHWRYEWLKPQRYYQGFHFWLDQF